MALADCFLWTAVDLAAIGLLAKYYADQPVEFAVENSARSINCTTSSEPELGGASMKLIGIGLLVLVLGCLPAGNGHHADGDHQDDPNTSAETAIERVLKNYDEGLKALFLEVADKLETGELSTEMETNLFLQQQSKAIREHAFIILNRDAAEIGGEKWSPQVAAEYWRKQGLSGQ
ncbi:hypothetical protein Pan54_46850 [Rubinisphaera italica]|uniref:Uncharacterized protein n=1 Tax=Rubinisphaera italica TaxID=2527969 RepID=A0A5C5XL26_9PLAN|nr:hypothetical protein Pan54_46850 [Rubinisphaera italica]